MKQMNRTSDIRRHILPAIAALAIYAMPASPQSHRLLINEIQVANIDMFIDPSFNYGAWIEVYNPTEQTQSLASVEVRHTDSEGKVKTYRLTSQHGMVAPHAFHNLWFDHNSADGHFSSNASAQIRFTLDADGGLLELIDLNTTIDIASYPAAVARCSWARTSDGADSWGYTSDPTPAYSNARSRFAQSRTDAPVVSTDGRMFTEPFSFDVSIPEGQTLYYTTDGSVPAIGMSEISTTGHFDVSQTTIYRFMLTEEGKLNSPVVTRSFIRNDKNYYLPVLSISSHPDNFFDNTIGLYVRGTNGRTWNNSKTPANQNMDWERPVNVEYLVPDSEANVYRVMLNQGANFSIFGGWTRFNDGDDYWEYKSSFKLKADKLPDGENYFTAPVFESKPYIKNKHILVRNGGQDQYERFWDAALQEMLRTSGIYIDCQAYQPSHVFINGRYLGMLNLREASNRKYAYSNYGIGDDEIDQWEDEFIVKAGTSEVFNRWIKLCNDLVQHPTDSTIWQQITDILDIDEYCNYMAAEIYMGNLDWLRVGLKNIKGFRANTDDGKIHVVLFDLDGCFGSTDMISQIMTKTGKLPVIFKNMMSYAPFRKQFVDAYCLMGGSVFLPERCVPIVNEITENIAPALKLEGLENTARRDRLINTLTDRKGHYTAAMNSLQKTLGLRNPYNLSIEANTGQARLIFNGQEIPAGQFDGRAYGPIRLTALAPEGYTFSGWQVNDEVVCTDAEFDLSSQLDAGTYAVTALFDSITDAAERIQAGLAPIRINEVSSVNDIYISEYQKKSDWIELYNTTDTLINLAGMYLSDNPGDHRKYQIPAVGNTTIQPHSYKLVWCDGGEPIEQIHASFKLANADSAYISIMAADESWIDELYYKAQGRWQSFGRYPDGADCAVMFDRITIESSNRALTPMLTQICNNSQEPPVSVTPQLITRGTNVVNVSYYNMNGQKIAGPADARIVIQKITYDNGYTEVRKVMQTR